VSVPAGGEHRHFIGELGQRGGVAFGELTDAAGEGLRDAVQLALTVAQWWPAICRSTTSVLISSSASLGVFGVELNFKIFLA